MFGSVYKIKAVVAVVLWVLCRKGYSVTNKSVIMYKVLLIHLDIWLARPVQSSNRNYLAEGQSGLTLGILSLVQTPSASSRSLISQAKMDGHSLLY